jgi:hypothetical protein
LFQTTWTQVLLTIPTIRLGHNSKQLYTLNDEFIVDFKFGKTGGFIVITEQGMEAIKIFRPFRDDRLKFFLYTGAYTNHHHSIDVLINP